MREGSVVTIFTMEDDFHNNLLAIIEKVIHTDAVVLRYCFSDVPSIHNPLESRNRIFSPKDFVVIKE
jgi:hypothetical protein